MSVKTILSSIMLCVVLVLGFEEVQAAPIHDAAQKGDIIEVQRLLRSGADINAKNAYGATSLMIAIAEGKNEVVELLLKARADVNIRKAGGGTAALAFAAYYYNTEAARLLLKAGADVNARDTNNSTALMGLLSTTRMWR